MKATNENFLVHGKVYWKSLKKKERLIPKEAYTKGDKMKSIPKVAEDSRRLNWVWFDIEKKVYITNRNCGCWYDKRQRRGSEKNKRRQGGITEGSRASIHGSLDGWQYW